MAIKSLYNDTELLQEIAKGSEQAFRIIYDQHKKKVYHFALSFLHSDFLAEEIMQEVFLNIWLMGVTAPKIKNLEAYLKTLTRNRCYDTLRKIIVEQRLTKQIIKDYTDSHNETEEAILLNDTRAVLHKAIDMLPRQQREVYLLCQQEGLKYQEVATKLNISVNTVKTHMKRALVSLRANIGNHTNITIILILLKLL